MRKPLDASGVLPSTADRIRSAADLARQHVRDSLRSLRRSRGLASTVALTVGFGVGASAAMFGVVDRLLLQGPAQVERAGELRRIYLTIRDGSGVDRTTATHAYPLYAVLRDHARSFAAVAAYNPVTMRVGLQPDAPRIPVAYATADFWSALEVRPVLGRFYSPDEDRPPRGRDVVVLSYGLWQRQYAGDSAVIGRELRLGGRQREIIGVAPRGFTGAEWAAMDAWVPLSSEDRPVGWESSWNASNARILGRLRAGVTEQSAAAEATALLRNASGGSPNVTRDAELLVRPLYYGDQGSEPPELAVARLLFGVAIVVMLIAAANAANLLLARGIHQRREVAIRVALGAGRGRLIGLLFTQAMMLALLGGTVGVVVAYWGGELTRATLFPAVAWDTALVGARVLVYLILAVTATAILIGVIPATRISGTSVAGVLAASSTQSAGGSEHQRRVRNALQVAQVALSTVLLVVAGLFVRSLMAVHALDLGVRPDRVLTAGVSFPSNDTTAGGSGRIIWLELLARVQGLPGVERAAIAVGSPFGSQLQISMRASGHDSLFGRQGTGPFIYAITRDYFLTMGTPVRHGRGFGTGDREGSEPVALVNETMATRLWAGEDPVGKCLYLGGFPGAPCSRVVGVVADARQSRLREDPVMQYYVPLGQEVGVGGNTLLVRVSPAVAPESFVPTLRTAIRAAAPSALGVSVELLASRIDPQIRPWRTGARMFGLFGGLALAVAAVGLFSVVSYLVSQRQREFGVRMALGAGAFGIAGLVLRRSLGTTALGVAFGSAVAYALGPFVQPYLFERSAHDPGVFGAAMCAVAVAAIIASIVPCVRAGRVDPVTALRAAE